jgi:hypothetical protein
MMPLAFLNLAEKFSQLIFAFAHRVGCISKPCLTFNKKKIPPYRAGLRVCNAGSTHEAYGILYNRSTMQALRPLHYRVPFLLH